MKLWFVGIQTLNLVFGFELKINLHITNDRSYIKLLANIFIYYLKNYLDWIFVWYPSDKG